MQQLACLNVCKLRDLRSVFCGVLSFLVLKKCISYFRAVFYWSIRSIYMSDFSYRDRYIFQKNIITESWPSSGRKETTISLFTTFPVHSCDFLIYMTSLVIGKLAKCYKYVDSQEGFFDLGIG